MEALLDTVRARLPNLANQSTDLSSAVTALLEQYDANDANTKAAMVSVLCNLAEFLDDDL